MASLLGPEWHISASGNDIITENGTIKDKQKILQNALNADIKEVCSSVLSSELSKDKTSKIVLQIQKVRNISAPKANEESQAAPRMLKLSLSDGENYVQAVELSAITSISRNNTPPGTKIVVNSAKIISGYILLSPSNCTVLGGKVPALIEKWEIAKSVQRTNRRGLNDDGAPPWVNFGKRIQSGNQEANFKSLDNKSKDGSKEHAEFEAQRQGAIAEANSGAVKKVFGGMVKQNVQPSQNRGPDRQREKKESFRGKNRAEREDVSETPVKPEKVSLFSFLEDKLPGCDSHDAASKEEDTFPRRKTKIPKEFQKPKYDEYEIDTFQKNSYSNVKYSGNVPIQQNLMEEIGVYKNTMNQNLPQDHFKNYQQKSHSYNKEYSLRENSDKPQKKPYENRGNNRTTQYETADIQKPQRNQGYNNHGYHNKTSDTQIPNENRRYNSRRNQNEGSDYQKPNETRGYNHHTSQNEAYNSQKPSHPANRTQPERFETKNNYQNHGNKYQSQSDYSKQSHKSRENDIILEQNQKSSSSNNPDKPNSNQNNVNMIDLTHGMEKITMNSQFASRTLRQHLNLEGQKKNEENVKKSVENVKKSEENLKKSEENVKKSEENVKKSEENVKKGGENVKKSEENIKKSRENTSHNAHTWKIGDDCLAKYWEDGKFYDATIMAITDRTVAVKFRGYGNIEEILTNDCLPTKHSNINNSNQGESYKRYEQNSRSYTGSMQFRRTPKNGYNNW